MTTEGQEPRSRVKLEDAEAPTRRKLRSRGELEGAGASTGGELRGPVKLEGAEAPTGHELGQVKLEGAEAPKGRKKGRRVKVEDAAQQRSEHGLRPRVNGKAAPRRKVLPQFDIPKRRRFPVAQRRERIEELRRKYPKKKKKKRKREAAELWSSESSELEPPEAAAGPAGGEGGAAASPAPLTASRRPKQPEVAGSAGAGALGGGDATQDGVAERAAAPGGRRQPGAVSSGSGSDAEGAEAAAPRPAVRPRRGPSSWSSSDEAADEQRGGERPRRLLLRPALFRGEWLQLFREDPSGRWCVVLHREIRHLLGGQPVQRARTLPRHILQELRAEDKSLGVSRKYRCIGAKEFGLALPNEELQESWRQVLSCLGPVVEPPGGSDSESEADADGGGFAWGAVFLRAGEPGDPRPCYPCLLAGVPCRGRISTNEVHQACSFCRQAGLSRRQCAVPPLQAQDQAQPPEGAAAKCHHCGTVVERPAGVRSAQQPAGAPATVCWACSAVVCPAEECRRAARVQRGLPKFICCHCLGVPQECGCPQGRGLSLRLLRRAKVRRKLPKALENPSESLLDMEPKALEAVLPRARWLLRGASRRPWQKGEHEEFVYELKRLRRFLQGLPQGDDRKERCIRMWLGALIWPEHVIAKHLLFLSGGPRPRHVDASRLGWKVPPRHRHGRPPGQDPGSRRGRRPKPERRPKAERRARARRRGGAGRAARAGKEGGSGGLPSSSSSGSGDSSSSSSGSGDSSSSSSDSSSGSAASGSSRDTWSLLGVSAPGAHSEDDAEADEA